MRLGHTGVDDKANRERLSRLLRLGLLNLAKDEACPFNDKQKQFILDMDDAIKVNDYFTPTPGQVFYAQDLFDRFCI